MGGEGGRGEGRPRKGLALTEQEAGAAGRASVRVAVGPAAETGRWGRGTVCGSPGGGSLVCADLQVSFRSTQVRGDDLPKSEVTPRYSVGHSNYFKCNDIKISGHQGLKVHKDYVPYLIPSQMTIWQSDSTHTACTLCPNVGTSIL